MAARLRCAAKKLVPAATRYLRSRESCSVKLWALCVCGSRLAGSQHCTSSVLLPMKTPQGEVRSGRWLKVCLVEERSSVFPTRPCALTRWRGCAWPASGQRQACPPPLALVQVRVACLCVLRSDACMISLCLCGRAYRKPSATRLQAPAQCANCHRPERVPTTIV
jgi:hypothetical protein